MSTPTYTSSYRYDDISDKLQQTVNGVATTYALDLAGGLTQVLADGTHTYLYGNGRIAQYTGTSAEYFLGDALGSVRQLADANGNVTLAKGYEPYGEVLGSAGNASTAYGFSNEWTDNTGLVYLRARYYEPAIGRFIAKDVWEGDFNNPSSMNGWNYVQSDPVNNIDPSGKCLDEDGDGRCDPGWQCYRIKNPILREQCSHAQCTSIPQCTNNPIPRIIDSIDVGEQFVILLQRCSGWWQDYMDVRHDTPTAISKDTKKVALSYVYKWEGSTDAGFRRDLGEALAHQYWENETFLSEEEGFYRTIGSKEVVRRRLCNHYGNRFYFCSAGAPSTPTLSLQNDPEMDQNYVWNEGYDAVMDIWGRYYNQRGSMFSDKPYEFANVSLHPAELTNAEQGGCPGQVHYISGYNGPPNNSNDACILHFDQQKCLIEHDQGFCGKPCEKP